VEFPTARSKLPVLGLREKNPSSPSKNQKQKKTAQPVEWFFWIGYVSFMVRAPFGAGAYIGSLITAFEIYSSISRVWMQGARTRKISILVE
jgi:hypothetical protein